MILVLSPSDAGPVAHRPSAVPHGVLNAGGDGLREFVEMRTDWTVLLLCRVLSQL
jgi:hypothetical protein